MSLFNTNDRDSQTVSQPRASHDFSDLLNTTNPNIKSLCLENQNNDSICLVVGQDPDPLTKTLSTVHMKKVSETIVTTLKYNDYKNYAYKMSIQEHYVRFLTL